MVLTKAEFASLMRTEIRILNHLLTKVDAGQLDYRPAANQRSLIELLRYLTIVGPIHLRGTLASSWSMDSWRKAWNDAESASRALTLEECKTSIASLSALFTELLEPCSDQELRVETEMFGHKSTRGSWLVSLVLNHYVAYRMQLFLYLKSAGHPELNTMNLWAGM